ncbi:MAG: hypothetical protein ABIJ00_13460 [Candidatus Eisenbacteria bacterium]
MLSLCLGEMCFAQTVEGFDEPDSVATEPETPGIYDTISPVQSISPDPSLDPSPVDAPDDSVSAEGGSGSSPVYKRWWVWAIAAVAIGVLVALAGGSSSTKADEDLPEFPDPPER